MVHSDKQKSKRSFGTGTVSSDRSRLTYQTPIATGGLKTKVLRHAVSSTSGQLPSSAEIKEVGGLSCGALDPEFEAEEDATREMYSQSDL